MSYYEMRKYIYDTYDNTNSFEEFISIIFPTWRNDIDENGINDMRDFYNGSKRAEKMVMEVLKKGLNSVTDYSNDKEKWDRLQWQSYNSLVDDIISCYEVIYDVKITDDEDKQFHR